MIIFLCRKVNSFFVWLSFVPYCTVMHAADKKNLATAVWSRRDETGEQAQKIAYVLY